ncbi:MAG: formimidoylglutamate deiminase [Sphingopyxis sp.]|uniref:formimidoylglutamate deiminase n=1 Tax=Sphingopyxis sp. TaxID=1908224 RepID=UPI002ABB89D6|nr:formimidoylglutamate deiminase [Sphingopyxis sp.]MDZ3833523.1 formimidoylglutamate deiminase [Sphingopyxis sp.]
MTDEARPETTLHFRHALLPGGWAGQVRIGIADGRIVTLAEGVEAEADDARHAVGLPGMPNLHSHAFQRGMAGLAEVRGPGGDSFWTWRDIMYRFVDRIDPDGLRAIAALAYVEMLESGFTRVGEFHYLHRAPGGDAYADPAEMTRAIVAAAADTGIALTHLPVFYAHAGFGGTPPNPGQRRFVHDLDGFARLLDAARAAAADLPDAIVGVAPHSLRAVTEDELGALAGLAGGSPIHIHIAEQVKEVEDCLAWSGQRPVEWLLGHAAVDPRWCLVHATHMTEAETRALAASGAVAGLCPVTEANLGDGLFPAEAFLAAGGRFGVGSDSNVLIDMSEELRWFEYGQRLFARGRNILAPGAGRSTGQALFDGALTGGAQALGVAAGLAVGHAADMVSLDIRHPSLGGRSGAALIDSFLFAAGRGAIDCVWRRGAEVVRGGRHVARDRIAADYRRALEPLVA